VFSTRRDSTFASELDFDSTPSIRILNRTEIGDYRSPGVHQEHCVPPQYDNSESEAANRRTRASFRVASRVFAIVKVRRFLASRSSLRLRIHSRRKFVCDSTFPRSYESVEVWLAREQGELPDRNFAHKICSSSSKLYLSFLKQTVSEFALPLPLPLFELIT